MGTKRSNKQSDDEDLAENDSVAASEQETPKKRIRLGVANSEISRVSQTPSEARNEDLDSEAPGEQIDEEASVEDEDEGDDDNDDETEERPLDNPAIDSHERRVAKKSTVCAESGVIESVTLVDFMCHQNLSIDLGPNMNFIIGHNGSGKSAILTAITVCLGGKAAVSGRGSSLKSFVRNGRSQATVTIRLKNKGPDAFNHDLYGDAIIIERKFGAEGGGGYTIKGADRQIHARRREDLDAITDHFALAIENPMNVLSQDTARQFLANATPRTLYDLFMKGIELQQLEADHNLLKESISSTSATLQARGRSLAKLKEQEEEAAKMFAETRRAREAQNEFDVMKNKMAWIQVRDQENHRNELALKVERESRNLLTLEERLQTTLKEITSLRTEIREVDEQRTNMTSTERGPIQLRADEQRKLFDAGKAELQRFQTDQRECHSHIRRQERTIEETTKAIELETVALAENDAGVQQHRLRTRRAELDEQIGSLRLELEDIEAQYSDANLQISEKRKEIESGEQEVANCERMVEEQRERIQGLRRATKNTLSAFHNNMERLLTLVSDHEKRRRWRECPIGPLGRTMTLKYPEWSDIVENFWGGRINGFLVSHYEDKQLLLRLMSDAGVRGCPVIQGKNEVFHFDEPEEKFLTVLRAIEWSDERVMRQLIITNHPESALLIKARREAELTMDPLNPPKHAARAFAIDPDDPARGYVIGGGARGSSMQQTTNAFRHPKRLTRSSETDIERCETALESAQDRLRSQKEILRLLEDGMRKLEKVKIGLYNRRNESTKILQRYTKELETVKEDLETAQAVDDGKLRGLQESLEATKQQKEAYESQYRAMIAEKKIVDDRQKEIKLEINSINQELEAFDLKLRDLEPRMIELTTRLQESSERQRHYERQVQERTVKKTDYETRLTDSQRVVDEYTSIAGQICERVEIEEHDTITRLQRLLEDKQNAIVRIRRKYGGATEAQIAERLTTARKNLQDASSEVNELRDLMTDLQDALATRQEQRKRFQKMICVRAKNNFVRHLSERAFHGKLSFKHDLKELHTHVVPADVQANMKGSGKAKRGSDNKVLSGGEKSFTTICLLLSIWEAMGCPIRALDEFDVFMDSVNRGISMKMMIESANDSIDKQFILITPQDMGGVKPTPTTKIHKLADPSRGVTSVTEGP